MPLRRARRLLLDDEGVRSYQTTMYAFILLAGLWAIRAGEIPTAVSQILGRWAHFGWVGLLIVGPLMVFAGMALELRRPVGLWLQLFGNTAVAFALATYVLALSRTVYAGRATFALWVVLGLVVCACRLVVRDVRKVRVVARVVRRLDGD
ncbi:hypothetical protein IU459_11690 [Nocardia amamiensis]|uniref:Uncharacterized protein n=1 Tax=Nocardia amamiensis TaxID=404578 RepID=A0ABS0CQX2_9NOCA|nr:hypothetical protein [Nocardia amamiensis]MBF6298202.1 hypothetical protein [Nocardia amamiensis]